MIFAKYKSRSNEEGLQSSGGYFHTALLWLHHRGASTGVKQANLEESSHVIMRTKCPSVYFLGRPHFQGINSVWGAALGSWWPLRSDCVGPVCLKRPSRSQWCFQFSGSNRNKAFAAVLPRSQGTRFVMTSFGDQGTAWELVYWRDQVRVNNSIFCRPAGRILQLVPKAEII